MSFFIEDIEKEEAERSRNWLQNNFEPWEDVVHHWEQSFPLRKNLIHDSTTYPNLCSIFDDWNILTCSQGYILVNNLQYVYTDLLFTLISLICFTVDLLPCNTV